MRIVIDCRFSGAKAGLGSYTRAIASNVVRLAESEQYTLIVRNADEPWLADVRQYCTVVAADIPHYSLAEQVRLPSLIRSLGADLLFSPHFNVPMRCPVPFVVTIHDLILHRYPNQAPFLKQLAYRLLIRHAVRSAGAVIAVSSFVQEEIAAAYGSGAAAKTAVILEGVDERFVPAPPDAVTRVLATHCITRDYFLYVGNAKQHKNVPLLIEAYRRAGVQDADLVLVSGGAEARALEPLPPGVRFARDVSDADLPALYTGARALVTASLYEGFCLPVAEALACGGPVVATNRTAIPQIASGRTLLLEPDADAYAAALRSPPPRGEPFVIGRWEQTARETRDLLLNTASA